MNGFTNIVEVEKKHRYGKLHIQSWIYIHCVLSMLVAIIGIILGIIFLVKTEWHENFHIYRLTLAYLRRAGPKKYWLAYRIFFLIWIIFQLIHLTTIVLTIIAVQKNSIFLLKPQLITLIVQIGIFILGLSGLLVISITASRFAWDTILIVLFYTFFASTNLILLTAYHRFLDDKCQALQEILLSQAKTVHFKDASMV